MLQGTGRQADFRLVKNGAIALIHLLPISQLDIGYNSLNTNLEPSPTQLVDTDAAMIMGCMLHPV